jgi:PhnB protein
MKSLNPYLNFPGNTEEAFNFYKSIFGGDFSTFMRFKDTPAAGPGGQLPPDAADKLMHVALPIKDKFTLMATDSLESMGHPVTIGNNINLAIEADTKDEADRYYNGLGAGGGTVTMPISEQFWGAYFGAVRDRFGVNWMISYNPNV